MVGVQYILFFLFLFHIYIYIHSIYWAVGLGFAVGQAPSLGPQRHFPSSWAAHVSFFSEWLATTPFNGHILSHSRCVNTLNQLLSGSTLGVSWRWFCVSLDQSLNLILRCGRQFCFVQFWAQRGIFQYCLLDSSLPRRPKKPRIVGKC